MNDFILETLSRIEWPTILTGCALLWGFKCYLDKKFEKIDQRFEKVDQRFEKVDQRFEKVDRELKEIRNEVDRELKEIRNDSLDIRKDIQKLDVRLAMIETTIRIQGGCKLNYDHEKSGKVE